jgi:hypothetical protein
MCPSIRFPARQFRRPANANIASVTIPRVLGIAR